jgi:hypothetical protein
MSTNAENLSPAADERTTIDVVNARLFDASRRI